MIIIRVVVLISIFYHFWKYIIKRFYFFIAHKEDNTGVNFKKTLEKETLMEILDEEFNYPNLKSKHYNEDGEIVLVGEFGEHKLKIDGEVVYVGRVGINDLPNSEEMKNIEEAECIKAYLRKIIEPNYRIDPELEYINMKSGKKRTIIAAIVALGFIVPGIAYQMDIDIKDIIDMYKSDKISASYMSDYDSEVTIGEVFAGFFEKPEWKKYKQGIQEYVDFRGTCFLDEKKITMVISFFIGDDYFEVSDIKIDGESVPEIMHGTILSSIYRNSNKINSSDLKEDKMDFPTNDGTISEYQTDESEDIEQPVDTSVDDSLKQDLEIEIVNNMSDYWSGLQTAIYTGYFGDVKYSMYQDSSLYQSQEKLVENLYNRGIYEEMISNEILEFNFDKMLEGEIEIKTKETIRIIYPDKDKIEDYYYTYVVRKDDDTWLPSEIRITENN